MIVVPYNNRKVGWTQFTSPHFWPCSSCLLISLSTPGKPKSHAFIQNLICGTLSNSKLNIQPRFLQPSILSSPLIPSSPYVYCLVPLPPVLLSPALPIVSSCFLLCTRLRYYSAFADLFLSSIVSAFPSPTHPLMCDVLVYLFPFDPILVCESAAL